jgi:dipeptidase
MRNLPIKKHTTLFVLIPFLTCFGQEILPSEYNCFSVLVGEDASVDDMLLFGHNDDEDDHVFQLFNDYVVPKKNYPKGAEITLQQGTRIPEVSTTNKFLWMKVPVMEVSDSLMNEYRPKS